MALYRLFLLLALPVVVVLTLIGRARGRLPVGALRERLGLAPAPGGAGPRLWLHGASLGELTSARGVVERLTAAVPGVEILVTANSATGRALAAGWGIAGVTAALAPYDGAGAPGRVLRRWWPRALIVVENELWPARLAAAGAAGVPVLVIGARLSGRSFGRWRRLPGLAAALLGRLDRVWPQDPASAARLRDLGLPPERLGPVVNLKAGVAEAVMAPVPGPVPRARCLLAASTHEGEEAAVLEAFAGLRAAGRFDLLILAPRHPGRGAALADQIATTGLPWSRRSAGQEPGPGDAVHLADTLGEMGRWYGMAGVTVVGGTFTDRGGHTPFEPVAAGSVVVHGPHTANHAAGFAALDAAGAALAVADESALAGALAGLDAERQARIAEAARAALAAPEAGRAEAALVADLLARAGL